MKVILVEKVPALGERGDICEVADGHARNFLFPKKLARIATPKAMQEVKKNAASDRKKSEQELSGLQQLAGKLDGYEVDIEARVSDAGTLYASVGAQKVAQVLKEKGLAVKKTQIKMKPIKEPGTYNTTVSFDHGLEAELTIIVSEAS